MTPRTSGCMPTATSIHLGSLALSRRIPPPAGQRLRCLLTSRSGPRPRSPVPPLSFLRGPAYRCLSILPRSGGKSLHTLLLCAALTALPVWRCLVRASPRFRMLQYAQQVCALPPCLGSRQVAPEVCWPGECPAACRAELISMPSWCDHWLPFNTRRLLSGSSPSCSDSSSLVTDSFSSTESVCSSSDCSLITSQSGLLTHLGVLTRFRSSLKLPPSTLLSLVFDYWVVEASNMASGLLIAVACTLPGWPLCALTLFW